jgi:prepilin-type N-terminal cleavage/methylation domain-containing protein
MQRPFPSPKTRRGFTLVELAVVIVIIGVLAAFGVPKFLASVEKSKATEAFNFWSAVQSAQERYIAQNGVYATVTAPAAAAASSTNPLDIVLPTLQYFAFTNCAPQSSQTSGAPTWAGTLTRAGGSSSYGSYLVCWTQDGFDTTNSNIPQGISPVTGDTGSGS